MMRGRSVVKMALAVIAASALVVLLSGIGFGEGLTPEQELGKRLYFDSELSVPAGQACASCHDPGAGFADPEKRLPVSEGALPHRFGNRNAPSSAYAAYSPAFYRDPVSGEYFGGQFWDGRATTLADQAKGPFLNALEMHNPNKTVVITKVRKADYAPLFLEVFGANALDKVDAAYEMIAEAIADFEGSSEVNQFTSKYDYYLDGKASLTEEEARGLELFEGKAGCASCHPSQPGPDGEKPLFTDYSYDNLGIPKNWENPFLNLPRAFNPMGGDFIDLGLGGVVNDPAQNGKFKVPTLHNIAMTDPYGHNGYFKTLQEIVDFYNTRDVADWPASEVPENVNKMELGNLNLTAQEVSDLVAFLKTLTDGYKP